MKNLPASPCATAEAWAARGRVAATAEQGRQEGSSFITCLPAGRFLIQPNENRLSLIY